MGNQAHQQFLPGPWWAKGYRASPTKRGFQIVQAKFQPPAARIGGQEFLCRIKFGVQSTVVTKVIFHERKPFCRHGCARSALPSVPAERPSPLRSSLCLGGGLCASQRHGRNGPSTGLAENPLSGRWWGRAHDEVHPDPHDNHASMTKLPKPRSPMTMSPGFKADPELWNRRVSLSQRVPVARASKAPQPRQNKHHQLHYWKTAARLLTRRLGKETLIGRRVLQTQGEPSTTLSGRLCRRVKAGARRVAVWAEAANAFSSKGRGSCVRAWQ